MFNFRKNQTPNNSAEAKLQALADVMGTEENMFPNDIETKFTPSSEEQPNPASETLADDLPMTAAKAQAITRDEALVRQVFELLGQDYDALIRMEPVADKAAGTTTYSPYAKAIQANPALLQEVLAAESPVLAALQIAMQFAPYADFTAQYGNDPQSIKAAMRKELQAEMQTKMTGTTEPSQAADGNYPVVTPFSKTSRKSSKQSGFREKSLTEIFGK